MDLPVLDPSEQRVLGSLMEKEITVPASYPLTLNSLRLACNQSTSRDPVVDYSENDLVEVTLRLQSRALVRLVRADSGARAVKYKQRLLETLPLPRRVQAELDQRLDEYEAEGEPAHGRPVEEVLANLQRKPNLQRKL